MILNDFASATIERMRFTKKTKTNYRGAYSRHVGPAIGDLLLEHIRPEMIAEVLVPLSPPTAHQTLMVLKMLFREAKALGLLTEVPTNNIRMPLPRPQPAKFLTWEVLDAIDFGRYDAQVRFLALHGLRWGEAVVLTEGDIRDGRVWINKSVHGATKTAAGIRSVPYLGHFEPFPKDRRSLARVLTPHGVTIHSLRKTYAYLLKRNGVHVTTAQRLLGHSSPTVTLAVYTQVLDDEIDEVGQILRGSVGVPLAAAS